MTSVSIIVPVFDAAEHLRACVDSILAQTHRDTQVILIDDGSTDGSGRICDEVAALDDRVVVSHRENGGIAVAQNAGLDLATGDLVTFCDNDDLMDPRMIARLVQILEDADADMSCCRWENVGASVAMDALVAGADAEPGRVVVLERPGAAYQTVFSLVLRRLARRELDYFSEANWGKLYRRRLFDTVRFPEGVYAQDVAVAMDLYGQMGRVASCSDRLYYWVQRGDSVSHSLRSTAYYHDIVRAHARSFTAAVDAGILPARAWYGLTALRFERRSARTAAEHALVSADADLV